MHIVIIGNGVAGMEAARTLRGRGWRGSITMVSEESDHFFSRPALMWVHAGQLSHRDIEPLPRDAYRALGLQRIRARAVALDAGARRLSFGGDVGPLSYDRLLLACGSRPRPAPFAGSHLLGVGSLVTLQDLAWYEAELWGKVSTPGPPRPTAHLPSSQPSSPYYPRPTAVAVRKRPASTVAVVGGGLLGCEAVELALARGARVHVFLRDGWFWPLSFCAPEARFVAQRLVEHGAVLHYNRPVQGLLPDPRGLVCGVQSEGECIACDAVVVAIGVQPNTEWLQDSALIRTAAGAIAVDPGLRTSAADVFAAGDCAAVVSPDGDGTVAPLWYVARDQGRAAGLSLLGESVRYQRGVAYNSAKLMDVEYTAVGEVELDAAELEHFFWQEHGPVRSTVRVSTRAGAVVGLSLLGRRWDHTVLRRLITEARPLADVVAALAAATFDTELTPRLRLTTEDLKPL